MKIDLARLEGKHIKVNIALTKDLMEENKENIKMAYRKIPMPEERS